MKSKIGELLPYARWAAEQIILEVEAKGCSVYIRDVYRTQKRQYELFANGRTIDELKRLLNYRLITMVDFNTLSEIMRHEQWRKNEREVTWTLQSWHTKGLAMDLKPIDMSFDDLKQIAANYGVTQPLANDKYHHEFQNCKIKPLSLSTTENVRRLKKAIERAVEPRKQALVKKFNRLRQRLR